jgi:hypothetical protein
MHAADSASRSAAVAPYARRALTLELEQRVVQVRDRVLEQRPMTATAGDLQILERARSSQL